MKKLLLILITSFILILSASCGSELEPLLVAGDWAHQDALVQWFDGAKKPASKYKKARKKRDGDFAWRREGDLGPVINPPQTSYCPLPDFTFDSHSYNLDDPKVPFVDNNRDVKDVSTKFVVDQFFNTPETLFNFMKLVYESIDARLKDYREKHGLDERAAFLLFKGGNVLRMVANTLFDQLPPEARDLLKSEFVTYFKRSDADFSIYVDPLKLGKLGYEKTFAEITSLAYAELGKIREEFKRDPQKYFAFTHLRSDFAQKEMIPYLEGPDGANQIKAIFDEKNTTWFGAKFTQLQFQKERAADWPKCTFFGQYDQKIESISDQLISTPMSKKPDWIANTDNRTLGWTWGSDPSKIVKFSLVRSKAILEYYYTKDGKLMRKPVGGELIDVSLPHRDDDRLRGFLDHYNKNVAEFTIIKDREKGDQLTVKSYSLFNLAEDLDFIIFDSFDRPWEGGKKYDKRVNRLFFLFVAEQLGVYGLGSEQVRNYLAEAQEKILEPAKKLYPISGDSAEAAKQMIVNAETLAANWPGLPMANDFWRAFSNFVGKRLLALQKEGDEEGLKYLVEVIEENLGFALQLANMSPPMPIDLGRIYQVDLKNLI